MILSKGQTPTHQDGCDSESLLCSYDLLPESSHFNCLLSLAAVVATGNKPSISHDWERDAALNPKPLTLIMCCTFRHDVV